MHWHLISLAFVLGIVGQARRRRALHGRRCGRSRDGRAAACGWRCPSITPGPQRRNTPDPRRACRPARGRRDAAGTWCGRAGTNAGGFTPLHAAAYSGSVPIAVLLLDKGAVIEDAQNKAGATPLLVAAEQNQVAVVELLISRGASVSAPESHGYMPLTRAFWKGNVDVVRLLKRHGATCQSAEVLGGDAFYQECVAAGN